MKITIVRSGGVAGIRREWNLTVEEQGDVDSWRGLIDHLPWDDVAPLSPQPDRYLYRIQVSHRQVTLPEQQLAGPWRELVDRVLVASQ